tara:strand:+ start:1573 stop:1776 length:204 start_codon:yes stop_codon:yes gene_type:complete
MDRKDTPHKDFLQPNKHVYVNYLKRSLRTSNATEKYTLHYLTNGGHQIILKQKNPERWLGILNIFRT